ncbi:hypothetical protein PIB30_067280, partial [Stylosanthes scabra]|nr:hypothetical protein [Stylosanthes scabra]
MGVENNNNGEFKVKVTKEDVVVAAMLPMQDHWLPLSNLDLLLPPLDFGVFFCYHNTTMSFGSMVGCLKNALAQALVPYYVLAGEVVQNSMAEPEILCNNRGVCFIEAEADVELHSLNLYNPDESIEGKFVPNKKHGILAVQATSLKCGGLVVACSFDHRIADAYSANMFLISWAQLAQPIKPTTLTHQPCFRRSLLSPRRPPPSIHPSIDHMYIPYTDLPPPLEPEPETKPDDPSPVISRIYYVTLEQLNHIQSLATSKNGAKPTKLETMSAFLWKLVASASETVY